jgi:hypothetical protein
MAYPQDDRLTVADDGIFHAYHRLAGRQVGVRYVAFWATPDVMFLSRVRGVPLNGTPATRST